MRQLWRGILLGFSIRNIVECGCVIEALNLMRDTEFDLVIVDQHLGDLTGAEFVNMLRRDGESPAPFVPIIACTADTRRSTIRTLVNAGVDEVLAKPVSAAQAWVKISTIVNNRRSFVRGGYFAGPDRRRRKGAYKGGEDRRVFRHEDCFID